MTGFFKDLAASLEAAVDAGSKNPALTPAGLAASALSVAVEGGQALWSAYQAQAVDLAVEHVLEPVVQSATEAATELALDAAGALAETAAAVL